MAGASPAEDIISCQLVSSQPDWRDRLLTSWWRRRWRGFLCLRRLLGREVGLLGVTSYGSMFVLDPLSYIDSIVLADGFYESEVLEALRTATTKGTVVWDIGANFGLHAMTLARLMPSATVVAFEPNPAEHARLLRHRALNAPTAVTCALALSSRAGVLPLHLGPAGNSGMTTLSPWSGASYSGTVLVATARGDDLVARCAIPAPNVIKLDVEGHEAEVLRGLTSTLLRPECFLVIFEDSPEDATMPKQLLQAAGFQVKRLDRRERTAHSLCNFVARKKPLT